MSVSAAQVKTLRELTGAGMMECKKALMVTNGNVQSAIEELRKSGKARADKKSGRIATEGVIIIKNKYNNVVILYFNSATYFVVKDDNFFFF